MINVVTKLGIGIYIVRDLCSFYLFTIEGLENKKLILISDQAEPNSTCSQSEITKIRKRE